MSETKAIPMLLWCPECMARHIDAGEFATKPHHTHACQSCGHVWRPAIEPTCGVQFLPGFKNEPSAPPPPAIATCDERVPTDRASLTGNVTLTRRCGRPLGLNGCSEHPTIAAPSTGYERVIREAFVADAPTAVQPEPLGPDSFGGSDYPPACSGTGWCTKCGKDHGYPVLEHHAFRSVAPQPAAPQGGLVFDFAWLIEIPNGSGNLPAYWDGRGTRTFHHDPNEAVRFARKEDAERVREWMLGADRASVAIATEHGWAKTVTETAKDVR